MRSIDRLEQQRRMKRQKKNLPPPDEETEEEMDFPKFTQTGVAVAAPVRAKKEKEKDRKKIYLQNSLAVATIFSAQRPKAFSRAPAGPE